MPHMMTQPERIEYMLESTGLSAAKFAKACGFTEASVSYWRNGSRRIGQLSAHQIEDRFPQFSTPWIMGETPYQNADRRNAADLAEGFTGSMLRTHQNADIAIKLADACGYTVETPFDRSTTPIEAATAFAGLISDNFTVTVRAKDGSSSIDVPLADLESWAGQIVGDASESLSAVLESAKKAAKSGKKRK